MPPRSAAGQPRKYAFLLIPGFSPLGFSCAIEALSLANHHPSGTPFYQWRLIGETGAPVPAYNGVTFHVDDTLPILARDETIVVCAGENVGAGSTKAVLNWLRREARKGMDIGAMSSGAYTLALAGLLAGRRVTTHWEYRGALTEMLPDVVIEDSLFSIDARFFTCAGGAASMDMMLAKVNDDYGSDLATWVADQMIYTTPRQPTAAQRMSLQNRPEARNGKLSMAIQIMDNNIEDPLTPDEIAEVVALSTRQLERLFAKYMGTSPKRYYLSLRLEKARDLLRQTGMSVTDVCVVCGFRSLSHFSKSYRANYGISPGQEQRGRVMVWDAH